MMLAERFNKELVPELMKDLSYANPMQVPRVSKVVINMGVGDKDDPKMLDGCVENLTRMAGQRPVVTRARHSISDFKLVEGDAIGCKVTLRGVRAYAFLEKVFRLVLPATRDFRGLSADSFDGRGNYTFGLNEQLTFPEINYNEVVKIQGMDITVVSTAHNDREGFSLMQALGCPFKKD
jgi:large subunit ribosomal protein L5